MNFVKASLYKQVCKSKFVKAQFFTGIPEERRNKKRKRGKEPPSKTRERRKGQTKREREREVEGERATERNQTKGGTKERKEEPCLTGRGQGRTEPEKNEKESN